MKMKKRKVNSGFTLVELVVVMVIVGILASLSVPMYRSYIQRSRAQEGVALVGSVAGAQKVHYAEHGSFLAIGDATGVNDVLGIDVRGNSLFNTFTVATSGTGESAVFTVTSVGTEGAAGVTVTATGGVTIPTTVADSL